MGSGLNATHLRETRQLLRRRLLRERADGGWWRGELADSALATAVAAFALDNAGNAAADPRSAKSLDWLCRHANADGGWGDTDRSPSNLPTTALCWATLCALGTAEASQATAAAERWLETELGNTSPATLSDAILRSYGSDRTFAVPILTMAALAGRLGAERAAWAHIPQLPFELGALPRPLLAACKLQVVSYALPALIAMGLVRHCFAPTRNPVRRRLRDALTPILLRRLQALQPHNGGFLEAAPLTGFVSMALSASGRGEHPVVAKAQCFLRNSARCHGSWPVDSDLATWVTTLATAAVLREPAAAADFPAPDRSRVRAWLLAQQQSRVHPYTGAAAGGWSWTDRPGAVPDADDTAGALLALRGLGAADRTAAHAAMAGVGWLLTLQNRDGGIPTFCRGWGRLPFDRSCPDITAHVLQAWQAWYEPAPPALQRRLCRQTRAACSYLAGSQAPCGSWTPLWFGHPQTPDQSNPVYGTARVLIGIAALPARFRAALAPAQTRAEHWLAEGQNRDGGWGGGWETVSSIEETAVAVAALSSSSRTAALNRGLAWLIERTNGGRQTPAAPIGLYFARLWYHEKLYPLIFAVDALERCKHLEA